MTAVPPPRNVRYRFGEFTLSPKTRVLRRGVEEVRLIPRYLDLLRLLVERRQEAVHRREIFDSVWCDVVVSEGALTQAIRTLRRTLGDDPREPRFIRTVSRHGYRFVGERVVEEPDDGEPPSGAASPAPSPQAQDPGQTARDLPRNADGDEPENQGAVSTWRLAEKRWRSASLGGGAAGLVAGFLGGAVLWLGPGSRADSTVPIVLAFLGCVVGALGAAGVGAGLGTAEVLAPAWRRLSFGLFGALGGGTMGALAHGIGQWTVQGLFGRDLSPLGGGFEGLVVGGAVGLAYAAATPRAEGGLAAPRGLDRVRVALLTGSAGGLAAAALAATGSHLGAMSLDFMARSFPGALVSFDPLARLLGESSPGAVTRLAIGAGEGLVFGFGLAFGLTHRPR